MTSDDWVKLAVPVLVVVLGWIRRDLKGISKKHAADRASIVKVINSPEFADTDEKKRKALELVR
jgi:hypothetical protein